MNSLKPQLVQVESQSQRWNVCVGPGTGSSSTTTTLCQQWLSSPGPFHPHLPAFPGSSAWLSHSPKNAECERKGGSVQLEFGKLLSIIVVSFTKTNVDTTPLGVVQMLTG